MHQVIWLINFKQIRGIKVANALRGNAVCCIDGAHSQHVQTQPGHSDIMLPSM